MDEIIGMLAVIFVVGVPALALAARFGLRPLVRDLTEAWGMRREDRETIARLADRVDRLERDAEGHYELLDQLADAEMFRRQLEEPPSEDRQ